MAKKHGEEMVSWPTIKKITPIWMWVLIVFCPFLVVIGGVATALNDLYETREEKRRLKRARDVKDFIKRANEFGKKKPEGAEKIEEPPKRSKNSLSESSNSDDFNVGNQYDSIEVAKVDRYDKYKDIMEQKGISKPKQLDRNMIKKHGCAHDVEEGGEEDFDSEISQNHDHLHKNDFGHNHEFDNTNHNHKHSHDHGKPKKMLEVDYKRNNVNVQSLQHVPEPVHPVVPAKTQQKLPSRTQQNLPDKSHQNLPDKNDESNINDISRMSEVGLKDPAKVQINSPVDKNRRRGGIVGLGDKIKVDTHKEKVYKIDNVKSWLKFKYEDKLRKVFNKKPIDEPDNKDKKISTHNKKAPEKQTVIPESKIAYVRKLFDFNVDKKAPPLYEDSNLP